MSCLNKLVIVGDLHRHVEIDTVDMRGCLKAMDMELR